MTHRARMTSFIVIATVVTIIAGSWVAMALHRASARASAPPSVEVAPASDLVDGPRVVFRNTDIGRAYGLVAMVDLADPGGPRALTDIACDRVYATAIDATCLRTRRGVTTTFEALRLDADWRTVASWPLPGVPSRTRISSDGALTATTSFVTGHTYLQVGFSTATEIRDADGRSLGDLEKFTLVIDGREVDPVDRNVWGVTFGPDDDTFYATVATGGTTYLVRGALRARTLVALRTGVECPSLSPDGTHLAYKHRVDGSARWQIAVLDLATDRQVVLGGEERSVDDQVEWLDDDIVLYGLPRTDEAGVSDIWSLDTRQGAAPELFIERAWSPSVVRS